jgi:transcriptional regulator with XRE-family HTH domain
MTTETKPMHQGRNVKRIREILGIKQDALAIDLGISQQAISQLEQKEALDAEILEKIAAVLKVPVEAIKSFDEEKAVTIISNTFNDEASAYSINYKCSFNPLDKVVELYERMIKDRDMMIEELRNLVNKK